MLLTSWVPYSFIFSYAPLWSVIRPGPILQSSDFDGDPPAPGSLGLQGFRCVESWNSDEPECKQWFLVPPPCYFHRCFTLPWPHNNARNKRMWKFWKFSNIWNAWVFFPSILARNGMSYIGKKTGLLTSTILISLQSFCSGEVVVVSAHRTKC